MDDRGGLMGSAARRLQQQAAYTPSFPRPVAGARPGGGPPSPERAGGGPSVAQREAPVSERHQLETDPPRSTVTYFTIPFLQHGYINFVLVIALNRVAVRGGRMYEIVEGDYIKCPRCGEWGVVVKAKVAPGVPVLRVHHPKRSCYLAPGERVRLELPEPPLRLQRYNRLGSMLGEQTDRVLNTAMRLAGHWYAFIYTGKKQHLRVFAKLAADAGLQEAALLVRHVERGNISKAAATVHVKNMIAALLADATAKIVEDKVRAALEAIRA
ncbi:MAG: hypothetical protein QXU69_10660 [Thermofilaceae archaeon]